MATDKQTSDVKGFNVAKLVLILSLAILLVCEGYFGYRLNALSDQQEQIKEDYSNVNN
ncbi:MAG: 2-methylisocitrate lyase, partial [Chryseobacterium sp.]